MRIKVSLVAGNKQIGTTWVKEVTKPEEAKSFLQIFGDLSIVALKLEQNASEVD